MGRRDRKLEGVFGLKNDLTIDSVKAAFEPFLAYADTNFDYQKSLGNITVFGDNPNDLESVEIRIHFRDFGGIPYNLEEAIESLSAIASKGEWVTVCDFESPDPDDAEVNFYLGSPEDKKLGRFNDAMLQLPGLLDSLVDPEVIKSVKATLQQSFEGKPAEPAKVFLVSYSSRSFEFSVIESDRAKALDALRTGLENHGAQYKLAKNWYLDEGQSFEDFVDGYCHVTEMEQGKCLRDCEAIPEQKVVEAQVESQKWQAVLIKSENGHFPQLQRWEQLTGTMLTEEVTPPDPLAKLLDVRMAAVGDLESRISQRLVSGKSWNELIAMSQTAPSTQSWHVGNDTITVIASIDMPVAPTAKRSASMGM